MLGVYARVDNSRGVHKAPANEGGARHHRRGTEIDRPRPGHSEQPEQHQRHPGFSRFQPGHPDLGGAVTTRDNAWKYIPVRRLFIFWKNHLTKACSGWCSSQTPNRCGPGCARPSRLLAARLAGWALAGITEEEAFFVRCDRTTMTEDEIANGQLIVLVGVAPVRPQSSSSSASARRPWKPRDRLKELLWLLETVLIRMPNSFCRRNLRLDRGRVHRSLRVDDRAGRGRVSRGQ